MPTKKTEEGGDNPLKSSRSTSSLQDAAEKKLKRSSPDTPGMKEQTQEQLIHTLQVHQIELEMQAEELRTAQLALELSRDQYLDLYEFAPLGYLTLTNTAIISQANLTAAGLLGVERASLINNQFRIWIAPRDLKIWDQYFTSLLIAEKKLTIMLMLKRGGGVTFPARLDGICLPGINHEPVIRVAISDISDVRTAEKALRRSEERFQLALRNAPVSVTIQDTNLVFQWEYNMHPGLPGDIKGKRDHDLFTPEEAERLIGLKRRSLESGKEVHEKIWLTMDGKRFFLDLYIEPLRDETGQVTGVGVATVDQTDQKFIEDALRQSKDELYRALELLEAVTKGTDVIIAVQDLNFHYTFFNQAYKEEMRRLTGKDLSLGSSMIELLGDMTGQLQVAVDEWSQVMKGENINKQIEFGDSDKYRRVYQVLHTPIRDAQGNIVGAGEVAYDVTKQTILDEELRETKEYLDNLITYANAPIVVWNPEFRITLFNRAVELLTGWKEKEVLGKPFNMLILDSHLGPAMDLIRTTLKGNRWDSVEIPILQKSGEIRTVIWNSSTILGADGETVVSTIAQGQDITERRKIEAEYGLKVEANEKLNMILSEEIIQRNLSDTTLKKTLSLLNASLESTADGIFVVDQQGKITSYNQNFVAMWNIPKDMMESGEKEMVMTHVLPQLKNPEEFLENINDYHAHPGSESFDMIEFKDGKIFERYSKSQKIGDSVVGRVWSIRDVTDRKHAEEKLVASIQEKEVLLREIHHRVKNNLQLISGLLDMTRMRTVDESTTNILTDMMLKIQTMAQIHTRLFESKQFGKISIPDQIHDQIAALSNIYSHKGHDIRCEIHSREVFLPVDQALPCSLAINEILSNAYKHAFKGREQGTIDISVVEENNHIHIIIHDDGIGIPDDLDICVSSSLGVKLIRTLVQHQLKGTFTMTSDCGTTITIDFPIVSEEA